MSPYYSKTKKTTLDRLLTTSDYRRRRRFAGFEGGETHVSDWGQLWRFAASSAGL